MGKTYAIADIHGRADLLLKAAELIQKDAGGQQCTVIVLGDYIDRGPRSMSVVAMLKQLQQDCGWFVLAGNHEAMMIEAMTTLRPDTLKWWIGNGGGQTLMSYGFRPGDTIDHVPEKMAEHIEWLRTRPIWVGDKHRLYVHGGVPKDEHIGTVPDDALQWWLYDSYKSPEHNDPSKWNDEPHISGKHIVHGHHQHHANPAKLKHRTNLDSFAWYTGRLAIGVFDDDVPGGPVKVMDALGLPYAEPKDPDAERVKEATE